MDKVPPNVNDPELYREIRNEMREEHEEEGKRWSAYSSGQLVKQYKKEGGTYSGRKKKGDLERWYEERWIDACKYPKIVECARENKDKEKMPYCRPLYRVNSKTPKTVKEMSVSEIKKKCKVKNKEK